MDNLPSILGPQAMGWIAALLTLLTFICVDMRRLRLLALAANAAFIAYGTAAELLPVMVLHLALVPVNLLRLNQAFQGKPSAQPAEPMTVQPTARQPRGWTPAPRGARAYRRRTGNALPAPPAESALDTAAQP